MTTTDPSKQIIGESSSLAPSNVRFHPLGDTERVRSNLYITLILIP